MNYVDADVQTRSPRIMKVTCKALAADRIVGPKTVRGRAGGSREYQVGVGRSRVPVHSAGELRIGASWLARNAPDLQLRSSIQSVSGLV